MQNMKKGLAVLFTVTAALTINTAAYAAFDYDMAVDPYRYVETVDIAGNGTVSDPYIANTAAQLKYACRAGGYVKLGQDITVDAESAETIYISEKTVYLDLAGCTYSVEFQKSGSVFYINQGNTLYISDSGSGGKISTDGTAVSASISAKLHINGGIIKGDNHAVFASAYSDIYMNKGTLTGSGGETLYLKGATLRQNGGAISTTASDVDSTIVFDSYYDSGLGNPNSNVKIGLYIRGGSIRKLYIPHRSANIDAAIYSTKVYDHFGFDVKNGDASSMFKGKCSKNLSKAILEADSDTKVIDINEDISVYQDKTVVSVIQTDTDINPVVGSSVVYPKAASDALYSFDSKWYDYAGQEISKFKNEYFNNKYTLRSTVKIKDSSKNMFLGNYFYAPNLDYRLCEIGIPSVNEQTMEYTVTFPMTPVFSVQPKDKADVTAGSTLTFNADAQNASTYTWYLTDINGGAVSWAKAEEAGVVSVLNDSSRTNTLKIKVLSGYANGFGVYCNAYGNSVTASSNTAKISMKKKTVTLSAGEGTGETYTYTLFSDEAFKLPECEYTAPEGKEFSKWHCNGFYFDPGETINLSADFTVNAVWKLKTFTVTFETSNGYPAPAPQTVTYGNKASAPTMPDDYFGQYVKNWRTSTDTTGTANVFDFDTAVTDDLTLYAEWTDIKSLVSPINGTYIVYYGDKVTVRGNINRTWEWLAMVDGKEILTNTLVNYQCVISAKTVAAGKTAVVASNDGRNYYITNLKYIYKQGDIDGDGDVDGTDAALYLKHLSGNTAYRFTAEQLKRADANYDGSCDMLDVIEMLK